MAARRAPRGPLACVARGRHRPRRSSQAQAAVYAGPGPACCAPGQIQSRKHMPPPYGVNSNGPQCTLTLCAASTAALQALPLEAACSTARGIASPFRRPGRAAPSRWAASSPGRQGARGQGGQGFFFHRSRTWNVLDDVAQKRVCVRHAAEVHREDGTHVSELPVSKQPVNATGGVPTLNTPKYCARALTGSAAHARQARQEDALVGAACSACHGEDAAACACVCAQQPVNMG